MSKGERYIKQSAEKGLNCYPAKSMPKLLKFSHTAKHVFKHIFFNCHNKYYM